MPADLDAFLTVASAPGVGAVWVPIDRATTWLIENGKTLEFVRDRIRASGHNLKYGFAKKKIGGAIFDYLKFEKEPTWQPTINIPHPSTTKTELSR